MPQYATTITQEAEVFLGTMASAQSIGAEQRRTSVRTVPGAYDAPVERYVGPDGRTIEPGAVYLREVIEDPETGATETGPWVYYAQVTDRAAMRRLRPVAFARVVSAPAGNPMRNPLGLPLVLADGTRPTQPATGEPARDPWTGELTGETQT